MLKSSEWNVKDRSMLYSQSGSPMRSQNSTGTSLHVVCTYFRLYRDNAWPAGSLWHRSFAIESMKVENGAFKTVMCCTIVSSREKFRQTWNGKIATTATTRNWDRWKSRQGHAATSLLNLSCISGSSCTSNRTGKPVWRPQGEWPQQAR